MDWTEAKRKAAERAVELVADGMLLGLGTGSTAAQVLEVIADRLRSGRLQDIRGVPTSRATAEYAGALGIPLTELAPNASPDLTLDGADEVDPHLNLIKGLGGALLWEKIVAAASSRLVIVVDESKLVDKLGTLRPLPVEVVPFGWNMHLQFVEGLDARAELRTDSHGSPLLTDSGHYLLDCRFAEGIEDPAALQRELWRQPGIVESGLFLGMAHTVVVAGADGVRVLSREG